MSRKLKEQDLYVMVYNSDGLLVSTLIKKARTPRKLKKKL